MYRISEFLTPSERLDAMRFGALKKLASMGYKPSDFNALVKTAGDDGVSPIQLLGDVLKTSVYIGAPVGALWYAMQGGSSKDDLKIKKLKATLDHYNSVTDEKLNNLRAKGLIAYEE